MVAETGYDCFISYSHALDRELAKALQRVLHRLGRPWYRRHALRVFRDDTTLAASPDLWASIRQALLSSRTFVLLASPESASSSWVGKEVALWRQERSRDDFLLVLTDGEIVWDDATGDFDWERSTALPEQLQGWFDSEPLWVDVRDNREGMRRREFRDGAAAVAAAIQGVPKDVLLSDDARQQRRLVAVLSGLLVLALVAGIVAVWQRNTAVSQRDRADQQARIALSRALAAESGLRANADPRLSTQLALAALGVEATSEAEGSVLQSLDRQRHVLAYPRRGTDQPSTQRFASSPTPTHVALTTDGSLLAFSHLFDKRITLWDTRTLRKVAELDPGREMTKDEFYSLSSGLSFSRDGTVLAADDGIRLQLWDVPNRRLVRTIENAGGGVQVFLSPDGHWVARTGDRRRPEPPVRVWRADTGEELTVPALAEEAASTTLTFDGAGEHLYAEFQDGIHEFDLSSRSWSGPLPFDASVPTAYAITDGAAWVALAADGAIELRDLKTGRAVYRHPLTDLAAVDDFTVSADAGAIAFTGADGRLIAVDLASGGTVELATHRSEIVDVAMSADGRMVASMSLGGDVILSSPEVDHRVLATEDPPNYGNATTGAPLNTLTAAAVGPRGDLAIVGRWSSAEVWTVPAMRLRTRIRLEDEARVKGVAISPDQTTFAVLQEAPFYRDEAPEAVLSLGDLRSGAVTTRIPLAPPRPPVGGDGVRFLPDGRRVLVETYGGPVVLDPRSRKQVQQLPAQDGGFTVNADATVLALSEQNVAPGAGGSWVEVWRWQDDRYERVNRFHESAAVADIALSRDGARVALSAGDDLVVVREMADPSRRRLLRSPGPARPGSIAFAPDGATLVQAQSSPSAISLWDVDDERLLGTWRDDAGDADSVVALDSDVNGRTFAGFGGGGLMLWQVDIKLAIGTLCRLAGELGPADRARYVSDAGLSPVCSPA